MFEKEAEETVNKSTWLFPQSKKMAKDFWQKGAEFGFQKGIKTRINTTTISDCPIKDEWHYPSKGEYPKDNGNVLLWCEPKFKEQHTKGGCLVLGYWSDSRFVQFSPKNGTIIAWKEIVLPKENEE